MFENNKPTLFIVLYSIVLILGQPTTSKCAAPDTNLVNQRWALIEEQIDHNVSQTYFIANHDKILSARSFDLTQPEVFKHSLRISFQLGQLLLRFLQETESSDDAIKFYQIQLASLEKIIHRAHQFYLYSEDPNTLKQAFQLLDQIKQVLIQKRISRVRPKEDLIQDQNIAKQRLQEQIKQLESQLGQFQDRLSLAIESQEVKLQQRYESQVNRLKQQIVNSKENLNQGFIPTQVASFDSLFWQMNFLEDDQALLSYFFGTDSVYAFVLNSKPKPLFFFNVGASTTINAALEGMHQGMELNYESFVHNSSILYQSLFKPLIKDSTLLPQQLTVVTDGPLDLLPFDALIRKNPTPFNYDYTALDYLIKHHRFSFSSSTWSAYQNFLLRDNTPLESLNPLSIAPGFSELNPGQSQPTDSVYKGLSPIPSTVEFVQNIFQRYSGQLLVGKEATIKNLLATEAHFNCLNIATHAYLDPKISSNSCILLSQDDSSRDQFADGKLSITKIIAHFSHLQQELVILGSCASGRGRFVRGRGEISLAEAFQANGISSIVYSLRPIQAHSSCQILTYFFQHLASGIAKDQALRQAKLDYLDQEVEGQKIASITKMPIHWASIQLRGNTRPFKAQPNPPFSVPLIATILAFIALLGVMGIRSKKANSDPNPSSTDLPSVS